MGMKNTKIKILTFNYLENAEEQINEFIKDKEVINLELNFISNDTYSVVTIWYM